LNWYGQNIIISKTSNCSKPNSSGFKKSASTKKQEDAYFKNDSTQQNPNNQVGEFSTLFDVQMYVMDSYSVKVGFSKTSTKFSVSFICNHAFLGTIAWDFYWMFDLNEFDRAKSCYDDVRKLVKDTMAEFVEQEIPTPMFWVYMKKRVGQIESDAAVHTNIPSVNYFHKYNRDRIDVDWRQNIYGPRYPKYKEESYTQYNRGYNK